MSLLTVTCKNGTKVYETLQATFEFKPWNSVTDKDRVAWVIDGFPVYKTDIVEITPI